MSPLERWNALASPDRLFLPLDPDELEIVCCDSAERTIAHTGIQWANVMFQSPALQKLRRSLPASYGSKVTIYHNGHLARIWVKDPTDGCFLEVLNTDPQTNDLTVKQLRDLEAIQGTNSSGRISAADGRKRIRDLTRQLIDCKNPRSKRALLKLLNLLPVDGVTVSDAAPAPSKSRKQPQSKQNLKSAPTSSPVKEETGSYGERDVPVFAVRAIQPLAQRHGERE